MSHDGEERSAERGGEEIQCVCVCVCARKSDSDVWDLKAYQFSSEARLSFSP